MADVYYMFGLETLGRLLNGELVWSGNTAALIHGSVNDQK